jgi:hypothetical protein
MHDLLCRVINSTEKEAALHSIFETSVAALQNQHVTALTFISNSGNWQGKGLSLQPSQAGGRSSLEVRKDGSRGFPMKMSVVLGS